MVSIWVIFENLDIWCQVAFVVDLDQVVWGQSEQVIWWISEADELVIGVVRWSDVLYWGKTAYGEDVGV